jgi:hypothetical protein
MSVMVTENYGTSGPPPLIYQVPTPATNAPAQVVLQPGNSIYLQNYRNAVLNDTMYFILTYSNTVSTHPLSGQVELEMDNDVELISSMVTAHREFYPNGENWRAGTAIWDFRGLGYGEERSILIPVRVLPNAADEITVKAKLNLTEEGNEVQGGNVYSLSAPIVKSHDPNLMIEKSKALDQCDYRGEPIGYTIKFQNTGEGATRYVKVKCFLDDKVDLNSIRNVTFPRFYNTNQVRQGNLLGLDNASNVAIWNIDHTNRILTFEMHDIFLRSTTDSTCVDLEFTRDEVSFQVSVKSNYIFGPQVSTYSEIIFDDNKAIVTDSVTTGCLKQLPIGRGGGFHPTRPTRPTRPWKWVIGVAISALVLSVGYLFKSRK